MPVNNNATPNTGSRASRGYRPNQNQNKSPYGHADGYSYDTGSSAPKIILPIVGLGIGLGAGYLADKKYHCGWKGYIGFGIAGLIIVPLIASVLFKDKFSNDVAGDGINYSGVTNIPYGTGDNMTPNID